jgi:hypothetical protein
MAETLVDVDVLGVEFNHDVGMQKSSGRPWVLIARNLSDDGHLSNRQGAELVEAVLARSRRGTLRHVVLLHLSQQCNQPELALEAVRGVVRAAGRRLGIHAARQSPAYPNLWIKPARPAGGASRSRGGSVAMRRLARPARAPGAAGPPILANLADWDRDQEGNPGGGP